MSASGRMEDGSVAYSMEHDLIIKKNPVLSFVPKCMELEETMLRYRDTEIQVLALCLKCGDQHRNTTWRQTLATKDD